MALETSLDLEDDVKIFNYDYKNSNDKNYEDDYEEDLSQDEKVSGNSLLSGIGGYLENNYSLLFFFLLLVIIFNSSGTFSESNESLLFFFLILVILFNQFY